MVDALQIEVIRLRFGLKPGKGLIFNCPDLKVGAIDSISVKGFSPTPGVLKWNYKNVHLPYYLIK
jgi:hypothetical protein